jgi:hypothetical protein
MERLRVGPTALMQPLPREWSPAQRSFAITLLEKAAAVGRTEDARRTELCHGWRLRTRHPSEVTYQCAHP